MWRKILSIVISITAVLFLIMGWSWIAMAANDPLSPRHNPEFLDKLSSIVIINPSVNTLPFPQMSQDPSALGDVFNLLSDVPIGPNILCNQDQTTKAQNEPSIDVNPFNPLHVISSSNDYRLRVNPPPQGDVRPGYYVSFDGGKTWPGDGIIDISPIPNTFAAGDPAIAIHDVHNVYYSYIAFNRDVDNAGGVSVSKSMDGGLSWLPPVVVAWNTQTIFHDKEYIAVDATGSVYDGNVYLSWTRFKYDSPIFFAFYKWRIFLHSSLCDQQFCIIFQSRFDPCCRTRWRDIRRLVQLQPGFYPPQQIHKWRCKLRNPFSGCHNKLNSSSSSWGWLS